MPKLAYSAPKTSALALKTSAARDGTSTRKLNPARLIVAVQMTIVRISGEPQT